MSGRESRVDDLRARQEHARRGKAVRVVARQSRREPARILSATPPCPRPRDISAHRFTIGMLACLNADVAFVVWNSRSKLQNKLGRPERSLSAMLGSSSPSGEPHSLPVAAT